VNFDDERLSEIKTEDLNKILQRFYELYGDIDYVVLDEVQNVEKWELFVNRLRRTKKVIITGSNSKLLAGELATRLTGRYVDIKLFPFSFKEFLDLNQIKRAEVYTTKERAEILKFLNIYLKTEASQKLINSVERYYLEFMII
jgi:predicted AAA+ superfamily ATPase